MSDHSLLSASSAERWVQCPISVTATGDSRTSEAAAEGTALHGVSENVLRGLAYPAIGSEIEADGFKFEYDDDRHRDVQAYVDYVRSLPWVGGYSVEGRIHYGKALAVPHNLAFGTSDLYGFTEDLDGRVLRIIDLKMGRKPVNPTKNPQAALYGAGVLEGLSPLMLPRNFRVIITIFQPRLSHKPFNWETTVGWIEDTTMRFRPAAEAAVLYKANLHTPEIALSFPEMPGDHCGYCRRKTQCKAFQAEVARIATPGMLVQWNPKVFAMRSAITSYLDDLTQLALDEATRGNTLDGTKLVRGKNGHAQLIAHTDVVRARAKELGVESLIVETKEVWATPAKIRDAFKKVGVKPDEMSKFITQPDGKLQIADASDPRPTAVVGDDSAFGAVAKPSNSL